MAIKTIYNIVGASNAGKDFLAELLIEDGKAQGVCKLANVGKSLFESLYGLPPGTMNDKAKRSETCDQLTGETYLDRFIWWFQNREHIFAPGYLLTNGLQEIRAQLWRVDTSGIVITDMRSREEMLGILDLVMNHNYYEEQPFELHLKTVYVVSPYQTPKISDSQLFGNLTLINSVVAEQLDSFLYPPVLIINDGENPLTVRLQLGQL